VRGLRRGWPRGEKCPLWQEGQQNAKVGSKSKKGEPERRKGKPELEFGPPIKPKLVRPDEGNTMAHLNSIAPLVEAFPATIAATIANVGNATVRPVVILPLGQGTSSETWECEVFLGNVSFVVHYHPYAEIKEGPQNGESKLHVKGRRASDRHETVTPELLERLGVKFTEK
jgi:hypothetical protein